ncbi:aspartate phosphatase [Bacillus atrophaeus]|uniref:response regulator aspartate phosphatase n=1 Tax=Bacillus atrophaeus TaxID=1452 RepID=UPI0022831C35|nr:aspartate phosphatase [Bacillus atrophaeus]MCY8467310.1 aspartate phosphatase [Bacillus atrophaeus]MCY8479930.1 aspartate phosphatase [Bacillus atrophaeus]
MGKIAHEVVANTLNELHVAIKKCELDNAKRFLEKAKDSLKHMEEDDKVIIYYQLLESRYQMMLFKNKGKGLPPNDWKVKKREIQGYNIDYLIDYYFYLYEAEYMSYMKNYERAMSLLKIAEKKLSKIDSDIEAAEFYIKAASLYATLHQSAVSLGYINEAINIYSQHEDYKRHLAISYVIKATNYMHLGKFENSEEYFLAAIKAAKEIKDEFYEAMQYHNISILYSNYDKSQECISAIKKAVRCQEWRDSVYYINSIYMIVRERFKIGDKDNAMYYLKKGQEDLKFRVNKIYETKINIIYDLYCKGVEESVDKCRENVQYLEEKGDLDGASDLSLTISRYYEKGEHYKEALEFANKAIEVQEKMRKLEGI